MGRCTLGSRHRLVWSTSMRAARLWSAWFGVHAWHDFHMLSMLPDKERRINYSGVTGRFVKFHEILLVEVVAVKRWTLGRLFQMAPSSTNWVSAKTATNHSLSKTSFPSKEQGVGSPPPQSQMRPVGDSKCCWLTMNDWGHDPVWTSLKAEKESSVSQAFLDET